MGWFSSRGRAERAELKKHKTALKSVKRVNKREAEIGELKDRTRLLQAKTSYKRAKKALRGKAQPDIHLKRKKSGKKLGKGRIRLI